MGRVHEGLLNPCPNQDPQLVCKDLNQEKELGVDHHLLIKIEPNKFLQEGEILNLHPIVETDPGLQHLLQEDIQILFGKDK